MSRRLTAGGKAVAEGEPAAGGGFAGLAARTSSHLRLRSFCRMATDPAPSIDGLGWFG
jgi:hypothetical protein